MGVGRQGMFLLENLLDCEGGVFEKRGGRGTNVNLAVVVGAAGLEPGGCLALSGSILLRVEYGVL